MQTLLRRLRAHPRALALSVVTVLAIWMVGDEINVLWGPGSAHSALFGRVAYEVILQVVALLCLARGALYANERWAWVAVGLACMAWGAGDIYYQFVLVQLKAVPIPSAADGAYLAFYPLVFGGVAFLFRARSGRMDVAQWLDGLTAGLAAGALSAAVVLDAVLGTVGGTPLVDATDLAYPVGDLLLLGAIAGALVVCGRRGGRMWLWVGLGISIFCVADGLYLVQAAHGTYSAGSWFDVGWPAGMVCLAMAAWSDVSRRAAPRRQEIRRLGHIALPMVFAAISIGLLLYTGSQHLNWASRIMAAASLAVILVRLTRSFSEYSIVTAQRELESRTDALTELGNRRALNADLSALIAAPGPVPETIVAIFDLDGFKQYNDTFGHPAGDALLTRLGAKLRASVAPRGRAYRMGGDEFCVVIRRGREAVDDSVQRASAALMEVGDGFAVHNSYGAVHMPAEAGDVESALRLADQRMYGHKGTGRLSAIRQSRDVLMQALREQAPELGDHTQGVRELAEAVAGKLGLDEVEREMVANTAALHDIGKMAIPRSILNKPGPLDAEEWAFMRRHTIIGQRIIAAAPVLADVATAVRATHERWDSAGYPDQLAGSSIPLSARVVAVCDAFDAIITERPYAASRTTEDAVAELKRCSGAQFDPTVVDAFQQVIADRLTTPEGVAPLD